MHPILFRIPIPKTAIPLLWVYIAIGVLALIAAVWQLAVKNPKGAGIAVVVGGVAIFVLRSVLASDGVEAGSDMLQLAPVPIYSYGVMLGLSLVVGWYLTLGLAERDGLPKETMANCYVVTAVAAVVGSRVLYILTNLSEFDSLGSMFAMRRGGLVAYGGFLGGFVGSFVFLRRHGIPLLPWADVAVPSLASGLMITRIGCYLFGCDFGHPLSENAPGWLKKLGSFPHWAKGTLENGDGAPAWVQHVKQRGLPEDATHSFPVHPTQIYESLVGAGLLILLLSARKHQKFRGQIFLLFTFAYGVCRYMLEVLRDDAERGSIPPALPQHVLLPLGLALLAIGYIIGFSNMITNPTVRRVTQVFAALPAIALYIALKPESFAGSLNIQLSTSQAVALSTGFAASLAFATFYKAALAHPETAMALNLPAAALAGGPEAPAGAVADEDEDEDEDAREAKRRAAAKKAAGKVAKKKKRAAVEGAEGEVARKKKVVTEDEARMDDDGGALEAAAAPEKDRSATADEKDADAKDADAKDADAKDASGEDGEDADKEPADKDKS
jgi:phosphatidylglycerol:prolipoprotein diacylglycerol transferase